MSEKTHKNPATRRTKIVDSKEVRTLLGVERGITRNDSIIQYLEEMKSRRRDWPKGTLEGM